MECHVRVFLSLPKQLWIAPLVFVLAKALITTAEPRGKQGQPAPEGFLGWKNTSFFLGGVQHVNFRQMLVVNKWPSGFCFFLGGNCFIRLLWGLTSGLNMAITWSTVWTSKNQELLKDPWKTSCCYRPFFLPLLPSLVPGSDKPLWLWVQHSQLGGPSCSTSGLSNKWDGTEYIFFVLSSNSDEVCWIFEVFKFLPQESWKTM